jgi:hypothetical protein
VVAATAEFPSVVVVIGCLAFAADEGVFGRDVAEAALPTGLGVVELPAAFPTCAEVDLEPAVVDVALPPPALLDDETPDPALVGRTAPTIMPPTSTEEGAATARPPAVGLDTPADAPPVGAVADELAPAVAIVVPFEGEAESTPAAALVNDAVT